MERKLDPVEVRVLGVLLEKQMATPEYYPLTLNALVAGCNQKSNRDPVLELDDAAVGQALEGLRQARLAWQVRTPGSRVAKYEHNAGILAELSRGELALLCELLLRGPQTAGELRARASRLVEFHGVPAVEHLLQKLAAHPRGPFVAALPRRPGHKECRYAHLLGGAPPDDAAEPAAAPPSAVPAAGAVLARLERLEGEVAELRRVMEDLRRALGES